MKEGPRHRSWQSRSMHVSLLCDLQEIKSSIYALIIVKAGDNLNRVLSSFFFFKIKIYGLSLLLSICYKGFPSCFVQRVHATRSHETVLVWPASVPGSLRCHSIDLQKQLAYTQLNYFTVVLRDKN